MEKIIPKQWFTLMELIVTITIVAILWTIAVIALSWYSKQARDASRISDMSRMKTGLELFSVEAWKYPEVSEGVQVNYSTTNSQAWSQWSFWEQTFRNVEKLDKIPLDPLTESKYIYSVTNTRKEYQLWWLLESDDLVLNSINKAAAAEIEWETNLRVIGNYNWKTLNVQNWTDTTILAVPSIIALCWSDVESIISNSTFAYDGFRKFPKGFKWIGSYSQCSENLEPIVNNASYVLFNWKIEDLIWDNWDQERVNFIKNMQDAYSWTKSATKDWIKEILAIDTNTNNTQASTLAKILLQNNWANSKAIFSNSTSWNSITWNTSNNTNSALSNITSSDWSWSDWIFWIWGNADSNWIIQRTNTRYCNDPIPTVDSNECIREDSTLTTSTNRSEEKVEYSNTVNGTTTNPDWSITITTTKADWTIISTTANSDWSSFTNSIKADNSIVTSNSDWSTTSTSSDWKTTTSSINSDWTTTITNTNPDWTTTTINSNGTTTTTVNNPDGSNLSTTSTSNGWTVTVESNPTWSTTTTVTDPDGSSTVTTDNPNWSSVTTTTPVDTSLWAINGNWSSWEESERSTPDFTTWIMYKTLTRYCNNPIPINWGNECTRTDWSFTTLLSRSEEIVEEKNGSVNGDWSNWTYIAWSSPDSNWTKTRTLVRYCNTPTPAYWWNECTRNDWSFTNISNRTEEKTEYTNVNVGTVTHPDNSSTITSDNGDWSTTSTNTNSDWTTSTTTTSSDWTTTTENNDGSSTTTSSDWTTTTENSDGSSTTINNDWSVTTTELDWSTITTDLDATTTTTDTNWNTSTTSPSWETTTTTKTDTTAINWWWSDWSYGSWINTNIDWTKVRWVTRYCNNPTPAYGGNECTRENGTLTTTLIRKEEKAEYISINDWTTTHTDGSTSTTTTNSDGSLDITTINSDWEVLNTTVNTDGTTETVNPDWSTTNTQLDWFSVTQQADGTTETVNPDWSVTNTEADWSSSTTTENPDWSITTTINNSDWSTTSTTNETDGTTTTTTENPDWSTTTTTTSTDGTTTTTTENPDTSLPPEDWGWSDWEYSNWTTPNTTTWMMYRTATRYCNNPIPLNWGSECSRTDASLTTKINRSEEKTEEKSSAEDGNWSDWTYTSWSSPNLSLTKTRTAIRYCNNPAPIYGWAECSREDNTLTTSTDRKEEKTEYTNQEPGTTTNPDWSTTTTIENSDWTTTSTTSNTNWTTTTTTNNTDWSSTTNNPDWSTTTSSNWTSSTSYPDWRSTVVSPNWDSTTTEANWDITTSNPDWSSTTTEPDWTTTTTEPDWTITTTEPNWTTTKIEPDWFTTTITPEDWEWSNWNYSSWSDVNPETGLITQEWVRYCNQPFPEPGWKWCSREDGTLTNWESFTEYKINEESLTKNWEWSKWLSWSWTLPDSTWVRTRVNSRYCNNPVPIYGWTQCSREDTTLTTAENPKEEKTETETVSLDWGWSNWIWWSREYLTSSTKVRFGTRYCNNPTPIYWGSECTREDWTLTSSLNRKDEKVDTAIAIASTIPNPLWWSTSMFTFPDSTVVKAIIAADGTSSTFFPDWGSLISYPNGNVLRSVITALGTLNTTTYPDWSSSSTTTHSNWTTTTSTTTSDWTKTTTYPDWSTKTETNVQAGAINWGWSAWKWSDRSTRPNSNNMYTRKGVRYCNNPKPEKWWKECSREDWSLTTRTSYSENKTQEKSATIDWKWTPWDWTDRYYAGNNMYNRKGSRYCNNPSPIYWGSECMREDWSFTNSNWEGRNITEKKTEEKSATINGGWSSWNWSGRVWVNNDTEKRYWNRYCNNPSPLYWGSDCMLENWSHGKSEKKEETRTKTVEWDVTKITYPDWTNSTSTTDSNWVTTTTTKDYSWTITSTETSTIDSNWTTTNTIDSNWVTTTIIESSDGTITVNNPDWSSTSTTADWTVTETSSDWTTTVTEPNWTTTETSSNWTTTVTDLEGTTTTTDSEGTTTTTESDWTTTVTDSSGTSTTTNSDWTTTTTEADGTVTTTNPDGTTTTENTDWSISTTDLNDTTTTTDTDWTVTETSSDWTTTVTNTDGTTSTTSTNPDWSIITTTTDSSWNTTATTTDSEGNQITTNEDGSVTTTSKDGTTSTTTTNSDWTTTTTTTDSSWTTTVTVTEPVTGTNWVCWDDTWLDLTSTPTNLCTEWTASAVTDNWAGSTYDWTCTWTDETPVSCSANNTNTPLTWWMAVDSNCDKEDITIWTQTWAWCNSTLWTWIEFTHNNEAACYGYWTGTVACTDEQNLSSAKESDWDSTNWIDAIWGKLYTHSNAASACSDWYHLPTTWEYNQLLNDLNCVNWLNDINTWSICYGLWWKDKNLKTNNNNLVNALWIPLAGYKDPNWDFLNRWLWTSFWSSSLSWTGAVSVNITYVQDFLTHTATDKTLALSVRCIKDGTTPSITANHPAWYAYIEPTNELTYYDTTWWTDLTIPDGVTSIWKFAFINLGMTSINLPSTLTTLKEGSLYGNNFTTITIPDSVTTIWSWALAWNESMTSVNLWSGLTTIDDHAFDSSALTSLTIPNSVTRIWDYAFDFNNISSLTLWNSVQYIWENAFAWYDWVNNYNSISTLVIPASVTEIWGWAFSDSALTSLTFEADVATIWDWAFNWQDESLWNWTVYWPAAGSNVYDTYHNNNQIDYDWDWWDINQYDELYFDDYQLPNYVVQ